MATPAGQISLLDIQNEFGGTSPISLSEYYAGGGLVPGAYGPVGTDIPTSGTISFDNLRNKSTSFFWFAIGGTLNQQAYVDQDLREWAISRGWNQSDKIIFQNGLAPGINHPTYGYRSNVLNNWPKERTFYFTQDQPIICSKYSNRFNSPSFTKKAALVIEGSFPNGVTIINYGFIIGVGGQGGPPGQGTVGNAGQDAIFYNNTHVNNASLTIYNYGIIAGGGGGGGGGQRGDRYSNGGWGSGGAGVNFIDSYGLTEGGTLGYNGQGSYYAYTNDANGNSLNNGFMYSGGQQGRYVRTDIGPDGYGASGGVGGRLGANGANGGGTQLGAGGVGGAGGKYVRLGGNSTMLFPANWNQGYVYG